MLAVGLVEELAAGAPEVTGAPDALVGLAAAPVLALVLDDGAPAVEVVAALVGADVLTVAEVPVLPEALLALLIASAVFMPLGLAPVWLSCTSSFC